MFDRLTANARRAFGQARREAVERHQATIGPEHLLLGILTDPDSGAWKALRLVGVDPVGVAATLAAMLPVGEDETGETCGQLPFTPEAKRVLEVAMLEAGKLDHGSIGTGHLLLGVLAQTEGVAGHVVARMDVDIDAVRVAVREHAKARPAPPRVLPRAIEGGVAACARDLVGPARRRQLHPFVGREREVRRCANVLARAGNTAVLLEGEPGVGKSAVVEGIAHAVADGTYPGISSIWRVDVARLVSGAGRHPGMLEFRIDRLIRETLDRPESILVLDDLHRVVQVGSDDGWWVRFRWMAKPFVERGRIGLIGVADAAASARLRSADPAFWGCFQTVVTEAPDRALTEAIVAAHVPRLQEYHRVAIGEGVLRAVVDLSTRSLRDRGAARAVVELLDHTLARARLWSETSVDVDAVVRSLAEMTGNDAGTDRGDES